MLCPICGARTRRLFVKGGYPIRECVTCRHQSVQMPRQANHITEVYGDHYFQAKEGRGSAGYPDYLAEADLLQAHGWQYAELLQRFMPLVRLCTKILGCLTRLEYPKWGMPLDGFWNIQTASKIAVLCIFCTPENFLSGEPSPKMYKVEL